MTDLAVETTGLTKRYRGGVLAVDGVDLRVARGEIYAFLGLNGAGKSTTIRMLLGMIRPTAGHAELFGQRVAAGATEPLATGRPSRRERDRLPGAQRPREPRHRAPAGGDDGPWRRGCGHRAAGARGLRGPAGRHAVARQPPAACPRPGAAPRARAARARRAGQRPRPGGRHRDPGADPGALPPSTASPCSCRATSSARSIGSPRGSGSCIAAAWSRSSTATRSDAIAIGGSRSRRGTSIGPRPRFGRLA